MGPGSECRRDVIRTNVRSTILLDLFSSKDHGPHMRLCEVLF